MPAPPEPEAQVLSSCPQLQEELLDPVVARVLANLDEPALLEHADRSDVALRHVCVQRARVDHVEEFREGPRRQPAAPEFSPDPVPDEPASVVLPAADLPATAPSETTVQVRAESFESVLAQCATNASRSRGGNAAMAAASRSRWCS